jgi:hypothetical protein
VHLDADAGLGQDAWRVERDGRLSTTRLAPGEHLMWLTHESAEHGKLASGFVAFELRENDWEELSVELLPLVTLSGELERVVPRPVVDGHVMIDLHAGSTYGGSASISASFEAIVAPDGTFAIPDLPRASGQVIALCRGWVSRRTRVTTLAEAGGYVESEPTPAEAERLLDEMGDRAFQAQRVTLPTRGPFVVAMEPTGTVEVTVRGPDGAPVEGAGVWTSPNVFWVGVGSSLFPWGEWSATTDAEGVARLAGLPPDDALWITVTHASLRLTRADRDRPPSVEVRSGDTTRVAIVLERADQ